MKFDKYLGVGLLTITAFSVGTASVLAEGLERVNLDTSFMFESGTYAELGMGSVNPSIPASWPGAGPVAAGSVDSVYKRFNVTNFAAKTQIGSNIHIGLWNTNQSSGVNLDWQSFPVNADLTVGATVGLVRYDLSDNFSIMGGVKALKMDSATLERPTSLTEATAFSVGSASTSAPVYGVSYQRPDIALRVELLAESAAEISATTEYTTYSMLTGLPNGGMPASGPATLGIGDALTLNFQTGIAANTLLFGSVRNSKWKDNQVTVPVAGEISTFEDGQSYTVGLGRKFSESVSGSISTFYDPASGCDDVSALSATCETRSISLGAKIAMSDSMDLNLGTTWSRRGTATVTALGGGASTTKSVVTSLGAKLSFKF